MRKVESTQLELGSADIGAIHINPKSRDDIPVLLRGLQHLYVTAQLRQQVFALLEAEVNPNARKDTGRPGMHLWRILVLAVLKQGLNCDYNRLTELANEHGTLRQIMGYGIMQQTLLRAANRCGQCQSAEPTAAGESQPTSGSGRSRGSRKKAWRNLARAR